MQQEGVAGGINGVEINKKTGKSEGLKEGELIKSFRVFRMVRGSLSTSL